MSKSGVIAGDLQQSSVFRGATLEIGLSKISDLFSSLCRKVLGIMHLEIVSHGSRFLVPRLDSGAPRRGCIDRCDYVSTSRGSPDGKVTSALRFTRQSFPKNGGSCPTT